LSKDPSLPETLRLRELAGRTLEAYRRLNTAAAAAAYSDNGRQRGEEVSRAGELLEKVVAELKGAA
jgi:hypothetical protein